MPAHEEMRKDYATRLTNLNNSLKGQLEVLQNQATIPESASATLETVVAEAQLLESMKSRLQETKVPFYTKYASVTPNVRCLFVLCLNIEKEVETKLAQIRAKACAVELTPKSARLQDRVSLLLYFTPNV